MIKKIFIFTAVALFFSPTFAMAATLSASPSSCSSLAGCVVSIAISPENDIYYWVSVGSDGYTISDCGTISRPNYDMEWECGEYCSVNGTAHFLLFSGDTVCSNEYSYPSVLSEPNYLGIDIPITIGAPSGLNLLQGVPVSSFVIDLASTTGNTVASVWKITMLAVGISVGLWGVQKLVFLFF